MKSEKASAFIYVFIGICLYPENINVNHPMPRIKNREMKIDQNGLLSKLGRKCRMRLSIFWKNVLLE
jgi:hypothetical protein